MSLNIKPESVTAVLLADGWHEVHAGGLEIDAYEYVDDGVPVAGSGAGFRFYENPFDSDPNSDIVIAGPLSSILAVKFL